MLQMSQHHGSDASVRPQQAPPSTASHARVAASNAIAADLTVLSA